MTFKNFPLLESLQKTLVQKGFKTPTEIQQKAIPELLAKRSFVGVAETGSGKTLSYVLPILHILKTIELERKKTRPPSTPKALVVVPTRELGEQVAKVFKTFTHETRLRVRSVLGGTGIDVAKENVRGEFEILVATPGRLMKMLLQHQVDLSDTEILIFDECDQMFDPGFMTEAKQFVKACDPTCKIGFFSATLNPEAQDLILAIVPDVEIYRTARSHRTVPQLKTENLEVPNGKRFPVLEPLIRANFEGGTVIFVNTREQCDSLAVELEKNGFKFALYRGEMDKVERRKNLEEFRQGQVGLLISTDLASRGLDLENVGRVINYHMPQVFENYLHRAGRTARAGRKGLVINFVTERDAEIMQTVRKST